MVYVIYGFAGLFIVLCLAMLFVFYRSRHIGSFIMAVAYGSAGLIAIQLSHWWPLVAGFVLVWMLKLLGLEPDAEPPRESETNIEPPRRGENQ